MFWIFPPSEIALTYLKIDLKLVIFHDIFFENFDGWNIQNTKSEIQNEIFLKIFAREKSPTLDQFLERLEQFRKTPNPKKLKIFKIFKNSEIFAREKSPVFKSIFG